MPRPRKTNPRPVRNNVKVTLKAANRDTVIPRVSLSDAEHALLSAAAVREGHEPGPRGKTALRSYLEAVAGTLESVREEASRRRLGGPVREHLGTVVRDRALALVGGEE